MCSQFVGPSAKLQEAADQAVGDALRRRARRTRMAILVLAIGLVALLPLFIPLSSGQSATVRALQIIATTVALPVATAAIGYYFGFSSGVAFAERDSPSTTDRRLVFDLYEDAVRAQEEAVLLRKRTAAGLRREPVDAAGNAWAAA